MYNPFRRPPRSPVTPASAFITADAVAPPPAAVEKARAAEVQGHLADAVTHWESYLESRRGAADEIGVLRALTALASLYTDLRKWNAAEHAFAEALQLAAAQRNPLATVELELGRAIMSIQRGNFERARALTDRILELADAHDLITAQTHAHLLAGVVARELGDSARAERLLDQAERMALDIDDLLLAGEAAREKADLLGQQDRHQPTLVALNRCYRQLAPLREHRDDPAIARRVRKLEAGFVDVMRRWAQRIESNDHATAGHVDRVADITCQIARRMGVDSASLFWYRIGALLHDIGKLAIPSAVLNKPGRLSAEEWALVKRHPSLGAAMLAEVDFPWEVRPIVESHHECWDGTGYPHGLAGSEIPLAARIFSVADVFDALISQRSFKQPLSPQEALDVMRREVGRQFDPAVFKTFEEIVQERLQGSSSVFLIPQPPRPAPPLVDDELTSVADRQSFMLHAASALTARRGTSRPVSILAVDVDWFRLINESYGRLQGDALLWAVAKVLQRGIRGGDLVGRRTGDEFLVLLPDASPEVALDIADRLRTATEQLRCARRDAPDETVAITISIGVASAPADGETAEAILAAADRALFQAKRDGRNRVAAGGHGSHADGGVRLALDQFVGREEELRWLVTLLDAASRGDPQLSAIVGEAGIGKSALVRQLEPEVRLRGGTLVTTRCDDSDVKAPLAPWADVIRQLHQRGGLPPREWRALPQLVPDLPDALWSDAAATPYTTPSTGAAPLQDEIVHYLRLASRQQPLVLVLEDMQWADAATWDVIEALGAHLDQDRLLLCITTREATATSVAERLRRLAQRRGLAQIALRRFSPEELRRWVQAVFHDADLGREFPEFLYTYTEGIPLHVIHLLRALREEGGIWYAGTRWEWRPLDELSLPTAIGKVLERRLDRLTSTARAILAAAAVIGPVFDVELLLAAASATDTEVRAAIDEGLAAAVLEPAGDTRSGRYAFTHTLLADAAGRSIPERQRQRLHEVAARMLELRMPRAVSEIASHYHAAGNDQRAYHYASLAAERSASVWAHDEAIASLLIAMRHAPSPADLVQLRLRLATLAEAAGRLDYAEEMCDLALEWLERQSGDSADAAATEARMQHTSRARRMRERLRVSRGAPPQDAITEIRTLLHQARERSDVVECAACHLVLADLNAAVADWDAVEQEASSALELMAPEAEPATLGEALLQLGIGRFASAPAEASAFFRDALTQFAEAQDIPGESRAWCAIGAAHTRLGHRDAALEALTMATELARTAHAARESAAAALWLAEVYLRAGEFELAAEWLGDAARLYSALRDEAGCLAVVYAQARLARERGLLMAALDIFDECAGRARDAGLTWLEATAYAEAAMLDPEPQGAETRWTRVNALIVDRPANKWFPGCEATSALAIGMALSTGHISAAQERFAAMLTLLERRDAWGYCWFVSQCAPALQRAGMRTAGRAFQHAAQRAEQFGFAGLRPRLDAGDVPPVIDADYWATSDGT